MHATNTLPGAPAKDVENEELAARRAHRNDITKTTLRGRGVVLEVEGTVSVKAREMIASRSSPEYDH
ncbi:hypothetical protein E2C01_055517 [Portunus trituberculatus]|uniref:Uncharacterized protein n=1 Tax=Portunus trituberculatus TaxID=210409 RepID=A0A5B7GVQ0_PORTR|nr:hypothetical protein [Portunus trituberculatus]